MAWKSLEQQFDEVELKHWEIDRASVSLKSLARDCMPGRQNLLKVKITYEQTQYHFICTTHVSIDGLRWCI